MRDLAHAVAEAAPGVEVSINQAALPDTRSYKVDFSLYRELAPAHQPQMTLARLDRARSRRGSKAWVFADAEFRASP